MTGNCHVRCGVGENSEIISKNYLSLFGNIPRFEELLATMRSMEISANVIIQNLSQLKKMYKDSWENVLGNCDSLLFLGGQEPTTLEHVSKTLGKETIDTRSHNRTRGRQGSTSENDGILGRELMTVDELKVMKDNECILFVRGIFPFFCNKFVIEKHPNYELLEDSNKENAYLLSSIHTVRFDHSDEIREEMPELYSEPAEDGKEEPEKEKSERPDNSNKDEELEVQMESIAGIGHERNTDNYSRVPKSEIENAQLSEEENKLITAEPHLTPPFVEVAEDNYLDRFDETF